MPAPERAKLTPRERIDISYDPEIGAVKALENASADKAYQIGVEEGRKQDREDIVAWLMILANGQLEDPNKLTDRVEMWGGSAISNYEGGMRILIRLCSRCGKNSYGGELCPICEFPMPGRWYETS